MRPPMEKIKQGILHADEAVRNAAIFYFSRSYSNDPAVMPLAIQAMGQYGLSAFDAYGFMEDLVQTEETVAWLIAEIERGLPAVTGQAPRYFGGLCKGLAWANPTILEPHQAAIESLAAFHPNSNQLISHRIRLSSLPPEDLWQELIELCADRRRAGGLSSRAL